MMMIVTSSHIVDNEHDNGWHFVYRDHEVLFDVDDHDKITKETWHMCGGYASASMVNEKHPNKNRHIVPMHRLVMGCPPKHLIVHHINEDRLDNRKSNLQIMTHKEHSAIHGKIEKMQAARKLKTPPQFSAHLGGRSRGGQ